jgi:4-amino-4-deoxy-L-arabinose transferase-like glycosyltransferase
VKIKPIWPLIIFLAVIKFLLPFILQSPVYEPHRDELLYLAEGHHVALGFMEVPPMLSLFAWLTNLFGNTMFWIKFWPSLFGAITLCITCMIAAEFEGKFFAQLIAGLGIMTGAYLRMHFLFQPNVLEILFWTLSIYFLVRFIKTTETKFLYGLAFSLALSWWSKYTVVFLAASIVIALLLSKHRFLFLQKKVYLAISLALLFILPNIWWQYDNGWPLVYHMRKLQETQLKFLSPAGFLIDQLQYLGPAVFVWIAGLIWLLRQREWRFLGWTYFFVIALLVIGRGKSYYSMGIYPMLLAAGGTGLQQWTEKRKFLRSIYILLIVAISLLVIPVLLPVWEPQMLSAFYKKYRIEKTGLLRWEDQQSHPLPQDFSDMLGWEEIAQKVAKAYNLFTPQEQMDLFIFCNNYGMAGAVNYYAPKYHLPAAYSDNASFLYWLPVNKYITNFILVTNDPHEQQHDWAKGFKQIIKVDSVTNVYARERGDYIYIFKGADENFNHFFEEKIKKDKAEFNY